MDENNSLDSRISSVKKQTCFSQLTHVEIEKLSELFTEKKIKAGETIVKEGDPVDSFYLIAEGTADVRKFHVKDNQLVDESVATLGPGESIGLNEAGFYSLSGMRTATVVAKTDMILYFLSTAAFHGFSLANTHVHEVMRKNASTLEDK
jgi:CRP-like cAMP-binding protein